MSWSLEGTYAENCNCDVMCLAYTCKHPQKVFVRLCWYGISSQTS